MSCITEILKLKGEQPALLPVDKDGKPWIAVEGGGTYKNHEYLIVLTTMGHRCGYVAVPAGHKLDYVKSEKRKMPGSDREYTHYDYDYDIECHGGVTFCKREHDLKDLLTVPCNDLWLGFDCAHAWDARDYDALEKYFGKDCDTLKFYNQYPEHKRIGLNETVKTYGYVELECKSMIDQLIEKAA